MNTIKKPQVQRLVATKVWFIKHMFDKNSISCVVVAGNNKRKRPVQMTERCLVNTHIFCNEIRELSIS